MGKRQVVEELVSAGQAKKLFDLLIGESPYSQFLTNPEKVEEKILLAEAVSHLWFFSEFGDVESPIEKGGKVYDSYPAEFEHWLNAGCPGLTEAALRALQSS